MFKAPSRLTLIRSGFGLAALAVTVRAAQLQLFQGDRWRARAAAQQTSNVTSPARRGTIFDRNGVALALSQETFGVSVAPKELDDPSKAATLLATSLSIPRSEIIAVLRSDRVWYSWPGPFNWNVVAPLHNLRGVYLQRRLERFYPRPDLATRLIGRVDARGRGGSGLERALDSVLAGRAGSAVMLRDAHGRLYPAPSRPSADPIDGGDVVLTLDAELQEISERALGRAVADAKASGGDVIILQPRTGEILALASVRRGTETAAGVIGDPYEPGSTAKIFAAAALLEAHKATPHDTVFAENGTWTQGERQIHDSHPHAMLTLADVIRVSSNIGIAKLGSRLTPAEQFEALRDFGFGMPTGVEYPGESGGRLRRPALWTDESAASLAMGYELSVTPIQLASAYAAIGNGGLLLEPTLVREVHDAGGALRWRHDPRPVRRAVAPDVASQLAAMLRNVVEEGTGQKAALGSYAIAGKTGTARRNIGGHYEQGRYTASFVGLFPYNDPQLVLLVKIDDPEGDYFGGTRAAPVTRDIIEAALATPSVAIDRTRISQRRAPSELGGQRPGATVGASAPGTATVTVDWPLPAARVAPDSVTHPVPDVVGQDLRSAARMLHRAGFKVRIDGWGTVTGTSPAPGGSAAAGATVVIRGESQRAS
ncbi:MAG TPA: penicillin-binding transpeptidase domain-containing protein [Gemmatimonadales bacterium]